MNIILHRSKTEVRDTATLSQGCTKNMLQCYSRRFGTPPLFLHSSRYACAYVFASACSEGIRERSQIACSSIPPYLSCNPVTVSQCHVPQSLSAHEREAKRERPPNAHTAHSRLVTESTEYTVYSLVTHTTY